MTPALAEHAFTAEQKGRLTAVAEVIDAEPLGSFADPRTASVLARTEVLLGHWGCPTLDPAALALAPELRLFAYAGGTLKSIVTPAVWEAGVVVTSAAAANAVPVAEYTLAAILLANKGVFASRERMRYPELRVRRPRNLGNFGQQVGIVGASFVGRRVVELLEPFDLDVVVADPFLGDAEAGRLGIRLVELPELFGTSAVVSIHAPDLPTTRGMVGAAELALLRDGATLINTARGALVDTDALVAEVASGRISAVLDVTDPEPLPPGHRLLTLPNAFVTPHVAGAQGNELARLADLAIREIELYAAGSPQQHEVRQADLDRIA